MMIYIVRHGETQRNADGRIQGRRDIELNENGRRQAEAAAEALRGKSFQALITSPLSRAKQTGAILAQFAQIAEVREDARIVERDFGELDGARFTEDVRHRLYQEKVQGAESLEEVAARMAEAFDEYVQQYDGDILVVSHGAAITALLKRLDPQLQRMHVHLNNASFSLLEWKDGAFTVINYNLDAAYLNGGEDDDE